MPRKLEITYLLPHIDRGWKGTALLALEDATALSRLGHVVRVLSQSEPPGGRHAGSDAEAAVLGYEFRQVRDFHPNNIPPSDIIVATLFTTLARARFSEQGRTVHLCVAYEGDNPQHKDFLEIIECSYRISGIEHFTTTRGLARRLRQRFGCEAMVLPYGIDEKVFRPLPNKERESRVLRIGLFGAWEQPWKDIETGIQALKLLQSSGLAVQLVRLSPTSVNPRELSAWGELKVEWKQELRSHELADLYRSLDYFIATSRDEPEAFFLPALEAMACGTPCILSDIPCFKDYASSQDYAIFVEAGSVLGLAEAIATVHGLPDIRLTLIENGMRVARAQTKKKHVQELEESFQKLVPKGEARSEGGSWPPRNIDPLTWQYEQMHERLLHDLLDLARIAGARGDSATALRVNASLTGMYPHSSEAWRSRGMFYCHLNMFEEAEPALRKALSLDPLSPAIHESLGRLMLSQHRFEEAVDHLREALRRKMPGAEARIELAMALFSLNRYAEAGQAIEDALIIDPDNETARQMQRATPLDDVAPRVAQEPIGGFERRLG